MASAGVERALLESALHFHMGFGLWPHGTEQIDASYPIGTQTRETSRIVEMPRDHAIRLMWPEACAALARAERLHSQFYHVGGGQEFEVAWQPPVDVFETALQVCIIVAMPGVTPPSITAVIEDGQFIVSGIRQLPVQLDGAVVHRLELPHGRFHRRIPLPPGRYGDVHSSSANGCLIVTLDKLI
jgi:HSP20 family protein